MRAAIAAIVAWFINAILVGITEALVLWPLLAPRHHPKPLSYFLADLATQCLYTIVAGYLCCIIARSQRAAMFALIALGLVIGSVSLVFSWGAEPHWYRVALLAVYAPCVWIGWTLRIHFRHSNVPAGREGQSSTTSSSR
jgi:hypothetical protein